MSDDTTQEASYEVINGEQPQNGRHLANVPPPTSQIVLQIAKVEIDSQIATAKMYSRNGSLAERKKMVLSMIKEDREFAEKCTYELTWIQHQDGPNKGKNVTGPSIRFAETIISAWGNTKVRSWIVESDQKSVTAACSIWDLELNNFEEKEAIVTIKFKPGKDAYQTEQKRLNALRSASGAAQSIVKRNVALTIIPRSWWYPIYKEAVQFARGTEAELPKRRINALKVMKEEFGVDEKRVFAALGISGIEDITLDIYDVLRSKKNSISEGLAIEDVFPIIEAKTSKSDKMAEDLKPAAPKEEAKKEVKSEETLKDPPKSKKKQNGLPGAEDGYDPNRDPQNKA